MKKLMIFSDLWLPFPGGAERYVANLSYELQKRWHTIDVVTSYAKAQDTRVSVTFRDIGVGERRSLGVQALNEELQRVQPDVIIVHHFFAYEFAFELEHCGIPVVQLIYNSIRLPFAKLAVYISKYTQDHCGALPEDMLIHPPAYTDIVAGIHGEKIGFIKPIHHKGIDFMYRLAARLPHRTFLVLRGEWQANEDIRKLPNVEFMEPVVDMREFYQHCKIMLMPSWNEDAGTVAQEAAMNGLPCISTDVMGLAETNKGGIQLERHEDLWMDTIEHLYKNPGYYTVVANRQRAFLDTFQWDQKFDELSRRLTAL